MIVNPVDVFGFVILLISIYIGLKILCKILDDGYKMQKETDEIWDKNGWHRPNKRNIEREDKNAT